MRDDFLDAFEEADFADGELSAVDDTVGAVLDRLEAVPSASPRRPWTRLLLGGGLVAAAAALALVLAQPGGPTESVPTELGPTAPAAVGPSPRVTMGSPSTVSVPAGSSVPEGPEPAVPYSPSTPIEPVDGATDAEGSPATLSGLWVHSAQVRFDGDAVVLASGRLAYRHDATHEPGVRLVRLAELQVDLVPVGTAFEVISLGQVAAMRIDEGQVQLVHEGTVLGTVGRFDDEVVVVPDPDLTVGPRVLRTSLLPLDVVELMVPDDCLCHPEDVVAAVTRLRRVREAQEVKP